MAVAHHLIICFYPPLGGYRRSSDSATADELRTMTSLGATGVPTFVVILLINTSEYALRD